MGDAPHRIAFASVRDFIGPPINKSRPANIQRARAQRRECVGWHFFVAQSFSDTSLERDKPGDRRACVSVVSPNRCSAVRAHARAFNISSTPTVTSAIVRPEKINKKHHWLVCVRVRMRMLAVCMCVCVCIIRSFHGILIRLCSVRMLRLQCCASGILRSSGANLLCRTARTVAGIRNERIMLQIWSATRNSADPANHYGMFVRAEQHPNQSHASAIARRLRILKARNSSHARHIETVMRGPFQRMRCCEYRNSHRLMRVQTCDICDKCRLIVIDRRLLRECERRKSHRANEGVFVVYQTTNIFIKPAAADACAYAA